MIVVGNHLAEPFALVRLVLALIGFGAVTAGLAVPTDVCRAVGAQGLCAHDALTVATTLVRATLVRATLVLGAGSAGVAAFPGGIRAVAAEHCGAHDAVAVATLVRATLVLGAVTAGVAVSPDLIRAVAADHLGAYDAVVGVNTPTWNAELGGLLLHENAGLLRHNRIG